MIEGLIGLLIWLVIVVVVAALILWAVRSFLPELYQPARLIVGGVVLIVILLLLLQLVGGGGLPRLGG